LVVGAVHPIVAAYGFVRQAAAIVVLPVADLLGSMRDAGQKGLTVSGIRIAVIVVVRVDAIGLAIQVGIRETVVDEPVAVVVLAVAGLWTQVGGGRIQGLTVGRVDFPVVVVILVADVAQAVQIGIFLVGIPCGGAVVLV
jgi:hypothetical protein